MRVNFKYKDSNTGQIYDDDAEVGSIETAEEEIREMIKEFNDVEEFRYGKEVGLRTLESIDLEQEVKDE